jgi:hypothetical protein
MAAPGASTFSSGFTRSGISSSHVMYDIDHPARSGRARLGVSASLMPEPRRPSSRFRARKSSVLPFEPSVERCGPLTCVVHGCLTGAATPRIGASAHADLV